MLSRYPDQARSRKGLAFTGSILLVFGLLMALWGAVSGAVIGLGLGCALLLPALLFGYARYKKIEKAMAWVATFGSLS